MTSGADRRDQHLPEVLPAPPQRGAPVSPVPAAPAADHQPRVGRPGAIGAWAAAGLLVLPGALVAGSFAVTSGTAALSWWALGWVVLAAAGCAVDWRTPRRWPGWSVLAAVPALLAVALVAGPAGWLGLPVLAATPWVVRTAARKATRPRPGLAESDVEFPVALAGLDGRLLVGRDQLVLDHPPRRHALSLAQLRLAQSGRFDGAEPGWWPLPGGTGLRIRNGPALRLVAGAQQWVVPVADPDLLAMIVRRRSTAAWSQRTGPADLAAWRGLRAGSRTSLPRRWALAPAAASAMAGSALVSTAAGGLALAGIALLAAAAVLLVGHVRRQRRCAAVESHRLPPASPDWGDTDPGSAPIPGWQPWNSAQR